MTPITHQWYRIGMSADGGPLYSCTCMDGESASNRLLMTFTQVKDHINAVWFDAQQR